MAAVELTGSTPLPAEDRARLRERISVTPGEPVVREEVVTGAPLGIQALEEHGYAHATVNIDQREVRPRACEFAMRPIPGPSRGSGRSF